MGSSNHHAGDITALHTVKAATAWKEESGKVFWGFNHHADDEDDDAPSSPLFFLVFFLSLLLLLMIIPLLPPGCPLNRTVPSCTSNQQGGNRREGMHMYARNNHTNHDGVLRSDDDDDEECDWGEEVLLLSAPSSVAFDDVDQT